MFHNTLYGAVPPDGLAEAVPSFAAGMVSLVEVALVASWAGCVTVPVSCTWQPIPSVMETAMGPAGRFCTEAVVAPLLQTKISGAVPPVGDAVAAPLFDPKQLKFVRVKLAANAPQLTELTVVEAVAVQPLPSVVVTE